MRNPKIQKEAIEQLREQVRAASAAARSNRIWGMELDDKRELARNHVLEGRLGQNINGWRNPYPLTDPRHMLLEYQFAYYHDRSRFKLMLASRQTGKDFTTEGEIADDARTRKTDWMVAAPSERQALDSLDQGKIWSQAFDLMVEDMIIEREGGPQSLLKSAEIILSNGSRIRAVPGRPDTVRGRSTNVFLTEFDFFDDPRATWRAILPSITNSLRGGEKMLRAVSTPNGKTGQMFELFEGAAKGKSRRVDWSRHKVTIYDAVLMGLPTDWLELQDILDDAEGWAQEFEVQFIDASGVLLPYELIGLCEHYDASINIPADFWTVRSGRPVVCGIDFGRVNDPSVCWTMELVGDVWWTREVLVMQNMPTQQQAALLEPRLRRANRVCMDYTGPGIGLGDLLAGKFGEWKPAAHKFGKVELCNFSSGFKAEIFPLLRSAMSNARLRLPVDIAVREDLHAVQQKVNNGNYSYWAPRTEKGHSDRCTALALAHRATASSGGRSYLQPISANRKASRRRNPRSTRF